MPEGTPSLLGDDQWPGDAAEDPLMVGLEDEAPEAEALAPDAVLPEPTVEVPPPADAASTEETPAPLETPAAEPGAEPITFGGRTFPSIEEAERSYREAQDNRRDAATRANRAEQIARAAQADAQAMREQFRAVQPVIERMQRPQIDPAVLEQAGIDPSQLAAVQDLIDRQVQSQVAPLTQRFDADRTAREAAQDRAERDAALDSFRSTHPDIPGEQQDEMVNLLDELGVIETVTDPLTGAPIMQGPRDASWYDTAYEAAQRPALARVLRANPALSETDDGMEMARLHASQLEATATLAAQQAAAAAPTAPASPPAPGSAAVLTGPANTPADTTAAPLDAIDEIVEADRSARRSIFAGGS